MKKTIVIFVSLWLVSSAPADAIFPIVRVLSPAGLQVGTTAEFEISGENNFYGAWQVLVAGTGITGEVVAPPAPKAGDKAPVPKPTAASVKFRLKAAPHAALGMREVRLLTPQGPTTLGNITVVRDPVIRENATPHASLDKARAIALPVAVCGSIHTTEAVDYFKFTVAAGTGLNFHLTGQRLQVRTDSTYYFNPLITIRNGSGTVLAVSTITFGADPLLHHRFDKAGEYFLEVRDSSYRGIRNWQYCIEINDRPFVTHAYPSRVTPGSTAQLRLFGNNLPSNPMVSYPVPADLSEGVHAIALPLPGGLRSNPVPLLVSRLPDVLERDGDKSTPAKAQPIAVPCGISGRIETEGEVDSYAFDAKKGERYSFLSAAYEAGSPLDTFLILRTVKGDKLTEVDDYSDRVVITSDSRIENWTAPDDGRYAIEIKDAQSRGGPAFTYFLKVVKAEPYFQLTLDTDKTILAPGIASPIFARVTRKDGFEGEVQLRIEGLPAGVAATCGRILPNGTDGCIVLQANPGAPRGSAHIRVTGTANLPAKDGKPAKTLTALAVPMHEIHMGGGGRHHTYVTNHVVAVCGPLDLKAMKISAASIALKPGESKRIDVTLERSAGFESNVTLAVLYQHLGQIFGNCLPEGVTMDDKNSLLLLTGDTAKGHITLKADAKAKPVKDQIVPIMAHVSVTFALKTTYCAEPLRITLTGP